MIENTVIMDFSGIYKEEEFFEGKEYHWMDFRKMEGVNCYCTKEAEQEIKRRILDFPAEGIHFLDSGNYHYLSKFWLDKIQKPFALLVFDNHTDMQESSFFGLLSCGSWVKEILENNENLREVCILGPSMKAFSECEEKDRNRVAAIEQENLEEAEERLAEFLEKNKTLPLYLSVDKDILRKDDARTNWDQGEVSLERLLGWLELAFSEREILGVDICGENPQDTAMPPKNEDLDINSRTNSRLWKFIENMLLDRKFLDSGQAELKLSIALNRYFDLQEGSRLKKRYQSYLSMRLRPGVEALIRKKENQKLERLLEENEVTLSMLDGFLQTAGRCKNTEAQLLLLQKKQKLDGFSKESWEL